MRAAIAFIVFAIGFISSGCSLCQPGYLCDYAGVGGKWQRTDPENGRVGSIFSDPNSIVAASAQRPIQSGEVPSADNYNYEEVIPGGDSILEPSANVPPTSDGGIIILGEQ